MKNNKSLNKFFALLLSLLVLITAGGGVKLLASPGIVPETDRNDDQTDYKAALTKNLQMPEGVPTPKAKFTFNFVATGDNAANTPALDPVEVNIAADAAGKDNNGIKTVTVRQLLSQISTADGMPFANKPAGIYEYTVTEAEGGIDLTTAAGSKLTKQAVNSKAEYKLQILVANVTSNGKDTGTPTGKVYIQQVAVVPVKNDEGGAPASTEKQKTGDNDQNGFIFNNKYSTTIEENTTNDPETAPFSMEKTVTGAGDIFQKFDFTIKITKPALLAIPADQVKNDFTYTIIKKGETSGTKKTQAYGTDLTFQLAHGDKLIINEMYGGSKIVTADETDAHGHTKTLKFTPAGGGTDKTIVKDEIITGQGAKALVTNRKEPKTQVGLFLDNAPIVLVITLSFVAILAFVLVNKKRQASR